jgi:hypothetical protein
MRNEDEDDDEEGDEEDGVGRWEAIMNKGTVGASLSSLLLFSSHSHLILFSSHLISSSFRCSFLRMF